jgi:Domain of unknown function (DUF5615)
VSVTFYFDENVNGNLAKALRRRRVDVLTVQKDGLESAPDPDVFDRSIELNRVLVSNDEDMLAIASDYMGRETPFPGLIFLYRASLREHLDALEYIAQSAAPEDLADGIFYLPL